ncbi:MAG TPA: Sec-independent protein translocase protein TatB [Stellaceae bacterium]|jgi:sec-independent protein translocase protein TatB|nr:Sec-independent protein translocase protein TatB [Stellaceae bacterium]
MFDFAWSELALIAVVALVVIGPKDLPRVMRMVGQWTRRARAIAREFQGSLDQMVREAELDEVKRHIDRATSFNVENEIRRTIDPAGDLQRSLDDPLMTNPLADPPKPVERSALEEKSMAEIEGRSSALVETAAEPAPETIAATPAATPEPAPEPEKRTP